MIYRGFDTNAPWAACVVGEGACQRDGLTASRQIAILVPWTKAALRLQAFMRQPPVHLQMLHESKYILAGEAADIIESARLAIIPQDEKE